jgi:hypothetical protein
LEESEVIYEPELDVVPPDESASTEPLDEELPELTMEDDLLNAALLDESSPEEEEEISAESSAPEVAIHPLLEDLESDPEQERAVEPDTVHAPRHPELDSGSPNTVSPSVIEPDATVESDVNVRVSAPLDVSSKSAVTEPSVSLDDDIDDDGELTPSSPLSDDECEAIVPVVKPVPAFRHAGRKKSTLESPSSKTVEKLKSESSSSSSLHPSPDSESPSPRSSVPKVGVSPLVSGSPAPRHSELVSESPAAVSPSVTKQGATVEPSSSESFTSVEVIRSLFADDEYERPPSYII